MEVNKDQPSEDKQRLFLKAGQDAVVAADSSVLAKAPRQAEEREAL